MTERQKIIDRIAGLSEAISFSQDGGAIIEMQQRLCDLQIDLHEIDKIQCATCMDHGKILTQDGADECPDCNHLMEPDA